MVVCIIVMRYPNPVYDGASQHIFEFRRAGDEIIKVYRLTAEGKSAYHSECSSVYSFIQKENTEHGGRAVERLDSGKGW